MKSKTKVYLELLEKQREEINNFPIAYAFNSKQLEEALNKLNAKKEECVTIFNHGDIVKKENAKPFIDMLKRHSKEVQSLIKNDHDIAEAAFLYEMDNHEYAINLSGDDDVLTCFGMDFDDLKDTGLLDSYRRARNKHMEHAREWEMI